MDSYNIIWCTLWSDYFMAQHQFDPESNRFSVPVKVAADFLFYLSEMLGEEKQGYYANNEEKFVAVELATDEIEKITDWIVDFNFATRKPLGFVMPDLYLDEEEISTKRSCLMLDYAPTQDRVGHHSEITYIETGSVDVITGLTT
jgi:hypothetical protein